MKVTHKVQLIGAFALFSIAALIYLSIPYYKNLESVIPWNGRGSEVDVQEVVPVTVDADQPQNESGDKETTTDSTVDVATPTDAAELAAESATESEQEKTDEAIEEAPKDAVDQADGEDRKAKLTQIQGKAQDTLEPKGNKVVLLTATDGKGHNNEIENLLDMVTENREDYCAFHEYKYQFTNISEFNQDGRIAVWNKIPAIQNAFDINPDAEWVWWLDMDIIIMTPSQDLASLVLNRDIMKERITYDAPIKLSNGKSSGVTVSRDVDLSKIDMIIAQDHAGINAGSMLFRRSDWTFSFLDMWVDPVYVDRFNNEQDALSHILIKHKKIREHVGFVPQRVINAYAVGGDEMGWHTGDILVHFAGCWVDNKCNERWQDFWPRRIILGVPDDTAPTESVESNNDTNSDGANDGEDNSEKKVDAIESNNDTNSDGANDVEGNGEKKEEAVEPNNDTNSDGANDGEGNGEKKEEAVEPNNDTNSDGANDGEGNGEKKEEAVEPNNDTNSDGANDGEGNGEKKEEAVESNNDTNSDGANDGESNGEKKEDATAPGEQSR